MIKKFQSLILVNKENVSSTNLNHNLELTLVMLPIKFFQPLSFKVTILFLSFTCEDIVVAIITNMIS